MDKTLFYEDLIQLDLSASSVDEFFEKTYQTLYAHGYVKESFLNAIKKREKNFPTALGLQPNAVAIPHTEREHVLKPFISFSRLTKEIDWVEMATDDVIDHVRLVFMIGASEDNTHLTYLQVLIDNLQIPGLTDQLLQAKTKEECLAILENMRGIEE